MRILCHYTMCSIMLLLGCSPAFADEEVLMILWGRKFRSEVTFEKTLKKLRPDVKFTYFDPKRNKNILSNMLRKRDLSKYKLIYTLGTTNSLIVKKHLNGRIPQIFNMVSAPIASKLAHSINKPGNNLTGTAFLVNLETQLNVLAKLKDYKTLGVFYDPREAHAKSVVNKLHQITQDQGRKIIPLRIVPDSPQFNELLKQASEKANQLDALYIVAGSSFVAHHKMLHNHLDPKLPIMTTLRNYILFGTTLTVGANVIERSQTAAILANRILSGETAGNIPINTVTMDKTVLHINKDKINQVGLTNLDTLDMKVNYMSERKSNASN